MLETLLPFEINSLALIISSLLIAVIGTTILYIPLYYLLRSIFRNFENDVSLVTLNVSNYPALAAFVLVTLKVAFSKLNEIKIVAGIESLLTASLIAVISYWLIQLLDKVIIYYLKEYTQQTEVMWDDVLLPIIEAVAPIIIITVAVGLILKSFGVDLTGIWVALGGATFIIGFAVKDILANFFSGIVLLIDTPFQFGDVLRLEDGSLGMLKKIGVRVTQLYMFNSHCDVYVPNSTLQDQNITNLSRPTSYYYYSTSIEIPIEWDMNNAKTIMEQIVLAHPDTLGDIDRKLEFIEEFYQNQSEKINIEQQSIGKIRLLAEQEVNFKLEEISAFLESLVLTIQFAEKGGLTPEEIANIQQEYQEVLDLIGLEVAADNEENLAKACLKETKADESLLELVREWYRACLKDPNLLENDQLIISEEWERKITLLTKRVQKLWQTISNPQREETRLDDYVLELITWLKERFKQPRSQWQEPQIRMIGVNHDEGYIYVEFELNFYVDDIKLEDGKRGSRLSSQIYQETIQHFRKTYFDSNHNEESKYREPTIVKNNPLVNPQKKLGSVLEKTHLKINQNDQLI